MAEQKKIHLELTIPGRDAELFRTLVANLRQRHLEPENLYTDPLGVEILYEEAGATALGNPFVAFSLWFDKPATAYWFALYLAEAKEAWIAIGLDKRIDAALDALGGPKQEGGQADG